MDRRGFIIVLTASIGSLVARPAAAGEPSVYTGQIKGVGAGGYDVVAYQAEGAARAGEAAIAASHDGISYRFASAANRDAFLAAPSKYLPQFGGYCAWAVANGYTAHADPEAWSVVEGKLYLNYSKSVRTRWARDTRANIVKGEANWPKVLE